MENSEPVDEKLVRLSGAISAFEKQELKEQLTAYINHLLLNNFNELVQLLYRVDVNEEKLKACLKENPDTDAALVITDLLIRRQEEKMKARESFKQEGEITDDEKW